MAQSLAKLRGESNKDCSLKHLCNVGGSLADQHGLSEMMLDRLLRHTLKKARPKYLAAVGRAYLHELVKLIERHYFGKDNPRGFSEKQA